MRDDVGEGVEFSQSFGRGEGQEEQCLLCDVLDGRFLKGLVRGLLEAAEDEGEIPTRYKAGNPRSG